MPNYQNTVSFQAPTDYTAEAQEIARRRKYAEALQAQSQEPLQGQMAGGWYVAPSWTQGANKIAQALTGGYFEKKAGEDEKALAERVRTEGAGDVSRFVDALNGTAAQPAIPAPADELGGGPARPDMPAVAGDSKKALMIAALSQDPTLKSIGTQGVGAQLAAALKPQEWKFEKGFDEKGREITYAVNPQNPMIKIPVGGSKGVTADTQAKLDQTEKQWSGLSENQRQQLAMDAAKLGISVQQLMLERARVGNQSIQTGFETGSSMGVPNITPPAIPQVPASGAPQGGSPMSGYQPPAWMPQSPPNAPQAPSRPVPPAVNQTRPQMQPPQGGNVLPAGLTPKSAQALALRGAEQNQEMQNKRQFNMSGLNSTIDKAEALLTGKGGTLPTASGVGQLQDWAGSLVGVAPKGAAQADQLRSIAGTLTAKMPRMEGPQSDKDVQLYREMAGDVGNAGLPISRRLAALKTVRELYAKYEGQQAPAYNGQRTNIIPPQGMSAGNAGNSSVMRFDAQGNLVQ
jgi:hypothetical protein